MEQFLQRCIDGLKSVAWLRESRVGQFLISVLAELQKVTWPSKQDIKTSTVVTLIVMAISAAYMGGAHAIVESIYSLVRKLVT